MAFLSIIISFLLSSHPHLASWFSVPVVVGLRLEKQKEKGATLLLYFGGLRTAPHCCLVAPRITHSSILQTVACTKTSSWGRGGVGRDTLKSSPQSTHQALCPDSCVFLIHLKMLYRSPSAQISHTSEGWCHFTEGETEAQRD